MIKAAVGISTLHGKLHVASLHLPLDYRSTAATNHYQ
jgi:hypothetical protein